MKDEDLIQEFEEAPNNATAIVKPSDARLKAK
jgi:hypothetical protein